MSNIMIDFYGFQTIPFSKELPLTNNFQSSAFQNAMGMLTFVSKKRTSCCLPAKLALENLLFCDPSCIK